MRIILEVPDPITPLLKRGPSSLKATTEKSTLKDPGISRNQSTSEAEPFSPRPDEEKFLRTAPIADVEKYLMAKLGATTVPASDASSAALASPPPSENDAPSPDPAVQPKTDRTQERSMRKKDSAPLTLGVGARAKQASRPSLTPEDQPTMSEAPSPRAGNLLDHENPNDIRDPQKDNKSVFHFEPPREA